MVACGPVCGQEMSDAYRSLFPDEARTLEPVSDTTLFQAPYGSDLFGDLTAYAFGTVKYARRGYDSEFSVALLNGVRLAERSDGSLDYNIFGALSGIASAREEFSVQPVSCLFGGVAGIRNVSLSASATAQGMAAAIQYSDSRYRWGIRFGSAGKIGSNWNYEISLRRRWGRDRFVRGVFTDAGNARLVIDRRLGPGRLAFFCLFSPSQRGLRSYATQETFDLTGDRLYNPSWGYFGGKVRNARVAVDLVPAFGITYAGRIDSQTGVRITVGMRAGRRSISGLNWFDARNPLPDYYTYLPSGASDPEGTLRSWQENDPSYTQIDWDELYFQNTTGAKATYLVEERMERIRNVAWGVSMQRETAPGLTVACAVGYTYWSSRMFKVASDLLGGQYFLDVDQYLLDDYYYADKTENNLLQPGRHVEQGDRFGYDFSILRNRAEVSAGLRYRTGGWHVSGSLDAAYETLGRKGYYEKEMFPGSASLGRSERFGFYTGCFRGAVCWSPTARHRIMLSFTVASRPPAYNDMFYSPRFSNRTVEDVQVFSCLGAELRYGLQFGIGRLEVNTYACRIGSRTEVIRYYDDIASVYSDMVLSGSARTRLGVELAAAFDLSSRLQAKVAGAVLRSRFASDPILDIYADNDGSPVVTDERSFMRACPDGNTPEFACLAGLEYGGRRGWFVRAFLSFAAGRYASPNPLRRTNRAVHAAASPETVAAFMAPEKLPSVSALDCSVGKWIRTGRGSGIYIMVAGSNLLGTDPSVYDGYESMRLRRTGAAPDRKFTLFDSKYLYAYPRSFFISLSGKF